MIPPTGVLKVNVSEPKLIPDKFDGRVSSFVSQLVKPVSVGAPERVRFTLMVAAREDVAVRPRSRRMFRDFMIEVALKFGARLECGMICSLFECHFPEESDLTPRTLENMLRYVGKAKRV